MLDPSEFESYDFEDFDPPEIKECDYRLCPTCEVPCIEKSYELLCPNCGEERPWKYDFDFYSKTIEQDHNTNHHDYMGFTVIGKNVREIRNYLRTCGPDYYRQSEAAIRDTLEQKIEDYKEVEIPDFVIDKTLEMYHTIKCTDIVFRSQGKWYVIGACLNYALIELGIPKNRKEICAIVGISEKKLSAGENQLEKLNDLGVVNLPLDPAPQKTFILNYLKLLEISESYVDFIVDLIYCAETQYLHVKNESRPPSRCVGSIYLLCLCEKSLSHIDKDTIADKCSISKSTFQRYYKILENNIAYLTDVFVKYDIPLRPVWKKKLDAVVRKPPLQPGSVYKVFGWPI